MASSGWGVAATGSGGRRRWGRRRMVPLPWQRYKARWVLGLISVLVLVLLSIFEILFLPIEIPPEGQPAPRTVRAPYDFTFDEREASELVLREKLRTFHPIFERDVAASQRAVDEIDAAIREVRDIQSLQRSEAVKLDQLRSALGPEPTREQLQAVLGSRSLGEVGRVLQRLLERILERGVMSDEHHARWERLAVRDEPEAEPIELPRQGVSPLADARAELWESAGDLLFGTNRLVALGLLPRIGGRLQPNLAYLAENDRRLDELGRRSHSRLVLLHRGDILIPKGQVVSLMDVLRLQAAQRQSRVPAWAAGFGLLFPLLILTMAFIAYTESFHAGIFRETTSHLLVFTILLVFMLLAKFILLFTRFSGYIMPIAIVTVLVVHLLDRRVALLTMFLASVYVTVIMNLSMQLFLYYSVAGVIALWGAMQFRRVSGLFIFSIFLGAVNVMMVTAGRLIENETVVRPELYLEAFLGGGMVCFLVLLVLPFFERTFNITTDFRLAELTDLSHPLLRELLEKAPGTYHHSLAVANLAGVAAEAVGANALLARAGGYFHDVGKIVRPGFFMENSSGGESPHEKLPPSVSVNIIKSHVTDGAVIAREWDLPREVIQVQQEHHGTTMMEFFYYRTKRSDRDGEVREEFFRYDGPNVSTLESAIVMIADSVEAISRVVHAPSVERAEEIVKEVIRNRFLDGQFDHCDLSTAQMAAVTQAMVRSLVGQAHTRTRYPVLPQKRSSG